MSRGGLTIALRPASEEDEPFLYRVYASTREDELSAVPWDDRQKEEFLRFQYRAQNTHYKQHYTGAAFDVILVDGRAAGRLYVARWPDQIRIIDIALLTEYRRQGIGAQLLEDLIEEAGRKGLPVGIHVEINNPALRLYERLGFRILNENGPYYLMERPPGLVSVTTRKTEPAD